MRKNLIYRRMQNLPEPGRLGALATLALARMRHLADDICGECVPRAYAPGLRMWMDQVQELARSIVTA